jgi:hypothetical protein
MQQARQAATDAKVMQLIGPDLMDSKYDTAWAPDQRLDLGAGHGTAYVIVTSHTQYLPLTISDWKVSIAGASVTATGPSPITLNPGESQRVPIALKWTPRGPVDRDQLDFTVTASAAVTSGWQAYLDEQGKKVQGTVQASGSVTAVPSMFAVYLLIAVVALLLSLIVYAILRSSARPARRGEILACLETGEPLGRTTISALRSRLDGTDRLHLAGKATVRGVMRTLVPWRRPDPQYRITYTIRESDGRRRSDFSHCDRNGSVLVNGMRFCHVASGTADAPCVCAQMASGTARPRDRFEEPEFR